MRSRYLELGLACGAAIEVSCNGVSSLRNLTAYEVSCQPLLVDWPQGQRPLRKLQLAENP